MRASPGVYLPTAPGQLARKNLVRRLVHSGTSRRIPNTVRPRGVKPQLQQNVSSLQGGVSFQLGHPVTLGSLEG